MQAQLSSTNRWMLFRHASCCVRFIVDGLSSRHNMMIRVTSMREYRNLFHTVRRNRVRYTSQCCWYSPAFCILGAIYWSPNTRIGAHDFGSDCCHSFNRRSILIAAARIYWIWGRRAVRFGSCEGKMRAAANRRRARSRLMVSRRIPGICSASLK